MGEKSLGTALPKGLGRSDGDRDGDREGAGAPLRGAGGAWLTRGPGTEMDRRQQVCGWEAQALGRGEQV